LFNYCVERTLEDIKLNLFLTHFIYMQLLDLNGIPTMFFCGTVMSHYTWHNVTESSRITFKYIDFWSAQARKITFSFLHMINKHYFN